MTTTFPAENHRPEVWAVGSLPPPVTGMSLLTEKIVQSLRERTPLTVVNFSAGDAQPRPYTRAIRLLRTAHCLLKLLFHARVQKARLYLTCNSRGGLIMTGVLVKAARRLGYKIYLHHHVYMYIDEYDRKMAWIARNMSANDVHLMHSPQMIDDFRARYFTQAQFEYIYPSIASLPLGQPRRQVSQPFRLGFLSNLTIAKGLDLVVDTFRALHERHRDVRLCLAGPRATAEAERLVANALAQFEGAVSYIGPVYDERKLDFFNSIDCFLLPSRTEGWPIVLNEALDAGVPVITTKRGCIRFMVGNRAGLVVDDEKRYVVEAVRQVEAWIDSPDEFVAASRAAIDQADHLRREAAIHLEQLVSRICSPTDFA
jgi:glycosyltransferase involved in cell wall biosynthesis